MPPVIAKQRPPREVYVEKCAACKSGASGRDGHPHLVEKFRANVRELTLPQFATFQCSSCGAIWRRLGPAERSAWSAERR